LNELAMMDGLKLFIENAWIVPIGVLLGMLVGATPGLTSSNSLAILLPVVLSFRPDLGLIFMVSIYAGAEMGNSFPAVLLNIPGTASSAVTTFDGYPMMQKGEAARALGICIMASTIGAVMGGIVSITAAPLIAKIALKFSPVEMFIIILFGIAVIGQISASGLAKGLCAGFFGLLLATTGTDPMWGQFRGTFGITYLIDGLPVIPVLIGLLAFSEMLLILERGESLSRSMKQVSVGFEGIVTGFKDVFRRPIEWLRSGFIGIFIGAIPGAGASIASFVAYQQAVSFASPEAKKNFGKGAPEGLIAADTSNNSMVGGSLVPLLTLGIPGSGSMAVLMVVMGYHGLTIGPRFFALNGDIAYAVLWSQFAAAFMVLIIGTVLAYFAYRVAYISLNVIVPIVAIFALIGGFAPNQCVFDMGLVVIFGLIGYIMKKYNYPPIAMLLGVILGELFEGNFFRSLKMSLGSPTVFFDRPLALILWALLILTLVGPYIIKFSSKRRDKKIFR